MDEATAKLIAEKGIWLSMQAFPDELAEAFPPGSFEREKAMEVFAGTDTTYTLAKKYKIKTAWGTDILFSQRLAQRHGELLAKLVQLVHPRRNAGDGDRERTPNCWRCPGNAIRTLASSAWSRKARSPTSCSSTAIRSPTSSCSKIRKRTSLVIMKDGRIYKNALRK